MKYCVALVIWLYLIPGNTYGQIFAGKVLNENASPISGAYIHPLNSNMYAFTNAEGAFTCAIPEGYTQIEIGCLGYTSVIIQYPASDTAMPTVIYLKEEVISMQPVIIYAGKEESVSKDIPVSVSVISGAVIQDAHITSIEGIVGTVPNFQYGDLGVGYQQQVAIRGISVFSETPAIATYVDDVPAMDITGTGLMLFDIDRIEVLRGGQGILYGRNAMGGVLRIYTRKPTNHWRVYAESETGNQGQRSAGMAIQGPLKKNAVFFGLSSQYAFLHGYYTNDLSEALTFLQDSLKGVPEDGQRVGDTERWMTNTYLKWLLNGNWSVALSARLEEQHSVGASAYFLAAANDSIALNKPHTIEVDVLGSDSRLIGTSNIHIQHVGKQFHWQSISSYQYLRLAYNKIDADVSAYNFGYGATYQDKLGDAYPQHVLSQELRWATAPSSRRISGIAGLYGFYQHNNKQYATVYDDLALLFGIEPGVEVNHADLMNSGAAAFARLQFQMLPTVKVTVGGRFETEWKYAQLSLFRLNAELLPEPAYRDTSLQATYQAFTPATAIEWDILPNLKMYLNISQGYRAGGINMFTDVASSVTYNPEFSTTYEAGYKGSFFKDKLQTQMSLFYMQWRNIQLDTQTGSGEWIIDNLGTVLAKGVEFEGQLQLNANGVAGVSIGLNDAHYGDFTYLGVNIENNQTIFAPKSTVSVFMQYRIWQKKDQSVRVLCEYKRMGEQYFDLINTIYQEPYHVANASITYQYKAFSCTAWGRNLTNARYITFAMPGYFPYTLINRPLQFGIKISWQWHAVQNPA